MSKKTYLLIISDSPFDSKYIESYHVTSYNVVRVVRPMESMCRMLIDEQLPTRIILDLRPNHKYNGEDFMEWLADDVMPLIGRDND